MDFYENHFNAPFNNKFDDRYFSADKPYEEKKWVFFDSHKIFDRIAALSNSGAKNIEEKSSFAFLELGFGCGINFAILLSFLMNQSRTESDRIVIQYYSCEKYPLSFEALNQFYSGPLMKEHISTGISEHIYSIFSNLTLGVNQFDFEGEGTVVKLCLYVTDVLEMLSDLITKEKRVNSVFLDGHDPKKNPEMWSEEVLGALPKLSFPNETTVSSYTVAGFVRRRLISHGFEVKKVKGFGKKREMLFARNEKSNVQ